MFPDRNPRVWGLGVVAHSHYSRKHPPRDNKLRIASQKTPEKY